MVLLDRSTLRLKAATAKLKKQAHCNMSRIKRTNAEFLATKRHKKHKGIPFVLFVPFVAISVYYRGQCRKQKS